MERYRIICPNCGAVIITKTRLSALLEDCPSCRNHVWDLYDALMADRYFAEPDEGIASNITA